MRRPTYFSNAATLISLATWTEANKVALTDWFEQLREYEHGDETDCEFAEFCGVQFDRERDMRDRLRHERNSEARTEYSNFDRDTGIAIYGEI